MNFANLIAKLTHKKGNIEWYVDNQKSSLGADFLLLDEKEQAKILSNFDTSNINKLLSNDVTVAQLWTLELLILNHLSPYQLVRRVWIIREKFRLQCGDEIYKRYTDSLDENLKKITLILDDTTHLECLRADVVNIVRQLQRINYNNILRSDSINERKKVVIYLTLSIAVIILYMFWLIKITDSGHLYFIPIDTQGGRDGTKFLLLIIGAGILGSAISLLQRIEKAANIAPDFTDSVHDAQQISLSMSNSYIGSLLLSGAVFALLVDFITISQLVNIFNISSSKDNVIPCRDVSVLLKLILPPDNVADVAKLLLFCFLSGFAERLVPDILDSLTKKASLRQSA